MIIPDFITFEINLTNIISESREIAQLMNEFSDNLEKIDKKYKEINKFADNFEKIDKTLLGE